jgi:hypothetical protein
MIKRLLQLSGLLALALAVTGLWAGLAGNSKDAKRKVRPQIGQQADAELGPYLSTEEMAVRADLIAIGRCVETRSNWFGRNLFTLATVSISDVVKGDQQSSVTVALPGGVDARRKFPVAMSYSGAPAIQPDEEVFLFLNAKDRIPEAYEVVGYSQGKLENDLAQSDQAGHEEWRRVVQGDAESDFTVRVQGAGQGPSHAQIIAAFHVGRS